MFFFRFIGKRTIPGSMAACRDQNFQSQMYFNWLVLTILDHFRQKISQISAYLRFQQEQRRSRRILRVERLSFEWKLANSAKTAPKKFFTR